MPEGELSTALNIIYTVLHQFSFNSSNLTQTPYCIADRVMDILKNLGSKFNSPETYKNFINLLKLIATASHSNKADAVALMDKFKTHVKSPEITAMINTLISGFEGIVAPR